MSLDDALALIDRVTRLVDDTQERRRALEYAGARAGVKMEEIAGSYPEPSGKPLAVWYDRTDAYGQPFKSKFKSIRQQRKVFALINAGKVPSVRTGRLGASLTSAAYIIDTGVVVKVGTNTPYAPFVIGGEGEQSHYHAGTWEPLQQKIDEHRDEVLDVFGDTLIGYIRGYVKGR